MKWIVNWILTIIASIWMLWVLSFGRADANAPLFKWFTKCMEAKGKAGGIYWNEFLAFMKYLSLHYIHRHDEAERYLEYTDYVDMTPFKKGGYTEEDWDELLSRIYAVDISDTTQTQRSRPDKQQDVGGTTKNKEKDDKPIVENKKQWWEEEHKPYTAFEPHKKRINEKALEESVISMVESHRRRFQEEVDKTVKTILKLKSYPNAKLLLFSDTNQQTVLNIQINKTDKADAEIYEKVKNSQYYQLLSKDERDDTVSFSLIFHNDEEHAKNTILDILVTIYSQPHECAIGYVTNVSGYNRPNPETTEKKKKSKAWLWILLILIVAGICCWYFMSNSHDSSNNYEMIIETTDSASTVDVSEDQNNQPKSALAFLDQFYKGEYENEKYIKENVTANVLNKLRSDFDYECDTNDCLATWVFSAYPPGADLKLEEGPIISETSSAGKFKVDFKYSGFNGEQKNYETNTVYLTVTTIDDKYLISDYEVVYQDEEPMEASDNALPANDEIIMSGTVSKYSIHMVLQIDGTNVTGYYYYDSQDSDNRVKLSGNISDDNVMKLEKYDSQGSQTGYFEGQFDGSTYSGSNINYSRDEALPFSVEKTN